MYLTLIMFQLLHQKCDNGANNYVVNINGTEKYLSGVYMFTSALNVNI